MPFADIQNGNHHHIVARLYDAHQEHRQPYIMEDIAELFPECFFLAECWAPDPSARPSMVMVMEIMDSDGFAFTAAENRSRYLGDM